MLPGFLLALREGIESALIVGMLLGALRKLGRPELVRTVWAGVGAAVLTSGLAAFGLHQGGASLEGPAEPIFEGLTMLAAAGLLTWMIFWMQGQSHVLRQKIEKDIRQAADSEGRWSLFGVAFIAVARDGIELALFLVALEFSTGQVQTLSGALIGLVLSILLGWLLFSSTRRLPLQQFFQVTNILLIFFAAGLVAHGVGELVEAGWIPAVFEHIYNINFVLNGDTPMGQLFTALFGYNSSPSLVESLAYLGFFLYLGGNFWRYQRKIAAQTMRQ